MLHVHHQRLEIWCLGHFVNVWRIGNFWFSHLVRHVLRHVPRHHTLSCLPTLSPCSWWQHAMIRRAVVGAIFVMWPLTRKRVRVRVSPQMNLRMTPRLTERPGSCLMPTWQSAQRGNGVSPPAICPPWYDRRRRSEIKIPKHLYPSRQMCVKGHLAICDPMRGSVPRVDEVHFNPQPSMWGATWGRGTSAERTHVRRSRVKLMVLSRSLNFRLTRHITPASYHPDLPIRPLSMPVINVIK